MVGFSKEATTFSENAEAGGSGRPAAESFSVGNVEPLSVDLQYGTARPKKPRKTTDSILKVPQPDEYIVRFHKQPFGMTWTPLKHDKWNLYVRSVEPNSAAARAHVTKGSKLIAINGESVEGLGPKEISQQVKAAGVPVSITFRKRSKLDRQKSKRQSAMAGRSSPHLLPEGSQGIWCDVW